MKTLHARPLFLVVLFCLPFIVFAQWHMVRGDGYNSFQKVFTVNDNTAFVIGRGNNGVAYFVLRTNDGGTTWDSIPVEIPANSSLQQLFFTDSEHGFIGGGNWGDPSQVLIKTSDNGTTWTDVTPNAASSSIISMHFINAQNGYVTDGASIYVTDDGGNSWTVQTPPFAVNNLSFVDMNNGFASGTMNEGTTSVIMKTTDGGQSWTTLLSIGDADYFFDKLEVINMDICYVSLAYNSNLIYKTTDGGNSWDVIAILQTWGILDFHLASGHVLSSNSEVFRTDDNGQNWTLEYAAEWGFYGPSIYYTSISFAGNTGFMVGYGMIKKYSIPNVQTGTVETESLQENIQLYPNPLAGGGVLHIHTSGIENQFDLQIINSNGQVVFERNQVANTPDSSYDLNLAQGIYYAAIQTNKTRNVGKLIIVE